MSGLMSGDGSMFSHWDRAESIIPESERAVWSHFKLADNRRGILRGSLFDVCQGLYTAGETGSLKFRRPFVNLLFLWNYPRSASIGQKEVPWTD